MNVERYFVYGPPASGKTLNGEEIARELGCECIQEEAFVEARVPAGAKRVLVLITDPTLRRGGNRMEGGPCIPVVEMKERLGSRWRSEYPAR